ncbi:hypothetical protein GCM10023307_14790 [Lysobacter hankyongensis]|uniref:Uncharacterized protein n=1 Tax=Lysobacter hankyongensis TaxID=1176535 RepID=A0ABP9B5H9_9GAMM
MPAKTMRRDMFDALVKAGKWPSFARMRKSSDFQIETKGRAAFRPLRKRGGISGLKAALPAARGQAALLRRAFSSFLRTMSRLSGDR